MTTFDAPSREACQVRRERTNTPLQALLLMNEPQFIEAARGLAERTLREGGATTDDRLTFMYRLVTARSPDAKDLAELTRDSRGPDGPLHEPTRRRQAVARERQNLRPARAKQPAGSRPGR